jgi:hypothetical protein
MNRWRTILAATIVAVVAAAAWVWHEGSGEEDATVAHTLPAAPVQQPALPTLAQGPVSDPAPAPASEPQAAPGSTQPEVNQATANVPAEPPNVDTPEPAQAKFARGGRADPDQN